MDWNEQLNAEVTRLAKAREQQKIIDEENLAKARERQQQEEERRKLIREQQAEQQRVECEKREELERKRRYDALHADDHTCPPHATVADATYHANLIEAEMEQFLAELRTTLQKAK